MDWLFAAHVLWFLTGAVFLLAEMALPGFVLLFFAIGSFAAALAAWAGLALSGQFMVFLAVSLAGVGLLRRMFLRIFQGRVQDQAPEAHGPAAGAAGDGAVEDDAAGKAALVTRTITPSVPGEIKFRGSFWRAEASVDIGEGENVVILGQTKHDTGAYTVRPAAGEK
ncbi:MAG: NfeD family protein [Proteobacteria bacterium]|nr:NfeD family protein [Pseudomonadota bacterium]